MAGACSADCLISCLYACNRACHTLPHDSMEKHEKKLSIVGLSFACALGVASALEGFLGFCLGCWMFGLMIRFGIVPRSIYMVYANTRAEQQYTWEVRAWARWWGVLPQWCSRALHSYTGMFLQSICTRPLTSMAYVMSVLQVLPGAWEFSMVDVTLLVIRSTSISPWHAQALPAVRPLAMPCAGAEQAPE